MKLLNLAKLLIVMAILNPAYAHDPSQHQQQGEKPDCEAMAGMPGEDHAGMTGDDPVMQAIMKKCMATQSADSGRDEHANHMDSDTEAAGGELPEPAVDTPEND